jgi:hypothetical protein
MKDLLLLGKLERVELRDIWKNEAGDFTPWLAKEENIAILGETIGRELEVEAQEQNVGPFKADILCKDTTDDHFVLIENQLEKTNHGHMGQLITYAAGLKAATIVWIAERFTEEHRAALDWLNEITGEDFNFFGLEIELWKIGDSLAAPKFNVVSKPNDWTAFVSGAKKGLSDLELTETKRLQLEYWTKLWELLEQNYPDIRGTKPRPQHWNNFSIGRSKFGLHSSVNTQKQFVRIGISCKGPNAEAHFELLKKQKEQIEAEICEKLEWEDLPHRKECRISIRQFDVDPTNRFDWPAQHQWIAHQLAKFRSTFQNRIKSLSANDYEPDDEPIE